MNSMTGTRYECSQGESSGWTLSLIREKESGESWLAPLSILIPNRESACEQWRLATAGTIPVTAVRGSGCESMSLYFDEFEDWKGSSRRVDYGEAYAMYWTGLDFFVQLVARATLEVHERFDAVEKRKLTAV